MTRTLSFEELHGQELSLTPLRDVPPSVAVQAGCTRECMPGCIVPAEEARTLSRESVGGTKGEKCSVPHAIRTRPSSRRGILSLALFRLRAAGPGRLGEAHADLHPRQRLQLEDCHGVLRGLRFHVSCVDTTVGFCWCCRVSSGTEGIVSLCLNLNVRGLGRFVGTSL